MTNLVILKVITYKGNTAINRTISSTAGFLTIKAKKTKERVKLLTSINKYVCQTISQKIEK